MVVRNGFSELAAQMFNETDHDSLIEQLNTKYSETDLLTYLPDDDLLVARAAATALGLIGSMDSVPELVKNLKNEDVRARFNTEMALWSIWSRSGQDTVDRLLNTGKRSLKNEEFNKAVECFSKVIDIDPRFAEGYNQRAIAFFILDEWDNSLSDCLQTIELNPYHFGAYAGMGHIYLRLGKIHEAVDAYKKALEINPNLITVAETLLRLRRALEE
ncbi:tetratricopeptide repeat protein [Candidatus Poribacteria bacterium]|nr:tetratricopeptide repeat protein [Candidatus Poribacteria bacterium]